MNFYKFNRYISSLEQQISAIIDNIVIYKNNNADNTSFNISLYISIYLYKFVKKNNYNVTTNNIIVLNKIYI